MHSSRRGPRPIRENNRFRAILPVVRVVPLAKDGGVGEMGSLLRHLVTAVPVLLAAVGVFGCQSARQCGTTPLPQTAYSTSTTYPSVEKPVADSLAAALAAAAEAPPVRPPVQVLSLTGGVLGAPFVAGVLSGWTDSGTRPTFDHVTGISSGA